MMRRLWRGEEVTLDGKVVSIANGRLEFAPVRAAIPIYIATQGEQISRLAGELADGVLIANTATEAGLDFYLGRIAEGAAKAARTLDEIDINLRWEICISPDEAAAVRVMRRRLAQRLFNGYPNWGFLKQLGVSVTPEFEALAARRDPALLDQAVEALPMEVVDANMLAGNAERVASRIAPLLRPEVTGVTIRPHACAGTGVEEVMRSFVEDVMPLATQRRQAG
jgi:5,10-methylenetetrahydromethanopterin reductase